VNVSNQLRTLLAISCGETGAADLLATIVLPGALAANDTAATTVPRATLATALCFTLFDRLLREVPDAARYVAAVRGKGRRVTFDHGALRTVCGTRMGSLPPGETALTRVLEPLGYVRAGIYPLERLRMTGRAYAHQDDTAGIPQFFVSEIHPERFSDAAQAACDAIFGTSHDPLPSWAKEALGKLAADRALPFGAAADLLPALVGCFDRQHAVPRLADYRTLLAESAEFAWIATEGNRFNHATDRVDDLDALVAELRAESYPMKDAIEISQAGSVRQTAFRAALVQREFRDETGAIVRVEVPGSFYEFIARDRIRENGVEQLDLRFDAANAQGIFKMTSAA
jgi:Domain of unknown function (DUF1338)